ncbi:predicted signal-transduction protein containing cAMP-binding and CBS domain [Aquitalea magnusonii]|uniref:Predicted signal-transduction protein containing cAMP-binding and CBS domain n=1 Tax=Aquitalea magnusonii TaxID=332411 RepID=A0A3G9GFB5_9NEIS|nr:DUF294 nucleotidyltransferase-like domain-containing protein [Aquitalea magnusonii]BBF84317.1 predicted signal-transduction protein containing cAMP-binding and CBS domain [Aquitalea magnusonii]
MPTPFPADWQALLLHEPFAAMSAEQLAQLASHARRQHFPRGSSLASPQAGPANQLFIVVDGQVLAEDIYSGQPFAMLGQGDMFPLGALLAQRPVTNHYRADSDCMVLQLPREAFVALCAQSPAFQLFCTQRLANLLSRARQLHPSALGGQGLSLHTPLSAVIQRPPVTCRPETALRPLLQQMQSEGVGSVVITSPEQRLLGLFTLRDLLSAHLAGRGDDTAVKELMRQPVCILPPSALASEAMLALVQSGERHVMVCEGSTLVGIVSEHDLYRLSRLDMKEMLQRLGRCDSTAALSGVAATFRRQVLALFKQGMDADASTRLLSLFNDQLLARLCQLHLAEAGLEDAEICWLHFGSSGRQENTLTSDQDSGLVFRCSTPLRQQQLAQQLPAIAQRICSALSACGIPLCRNGVMAGNPSHCLSLDDWCDTFISQLMQSADSAGHIGLYLDIRPAWGQQLLGLELASALRQRASDPSVLQALSRTARSYQPPLGWSGRLQTDQDDKLDLKAALDLFVDGARILALQAGSAASRTGERFAAAADLPGLKHSDCQSFADSARFLQDLRLRHQLACQEQGAGLDSLIDPQQLGTLDARILKETLRQARKLQAWLGQHLP